MLLSIIVPVYNEADAIPLLFPALRKALARVDCEYELVFVNDGSQDGSARVLEDAAAADPRVRVAHFTRNFGHQAAITAGLDLADGDAVVVMDADLQDPPDLLPVMVELYRAGYDVVSAQRQRRDGDGVCKRVTARAFYWLMQRMVDRRIVPDVGDFRLFSRAAVYAVRQFREQHRFMRGLIAWLGLKEAVVPFDRGPRSAGETKYPWWKMVRFAWTAICSFSALPLRLSLGGGLALTLFGLVYLGYSFFRAFIEHATVPGWTSLVCLQIIFSGATLLAIGLAGDYVARLYDEAKGRPLYIVGETSNVADRPAAPRSIVLPRRETQGDGLAALSARVSELAEGARDLSKAARVDPVSNPATED